jgi:hypothetical protein
VTAINCAARAAARPRLAVSVPALQRPARPTLQALMLRLTTEQHIDMRGNGHLPEAQTLRLEPADLAELQRLLCPQRTTTS